MAHPRLGCQWVSWTHLSLGKGRHLGNRRLGLPSQEVTNSYFTGRLQVVPKSRVAPER